MSSVYPVFAVLFSPVKAFRAMPEGSRTTWVPPFVLCALFSVLIAWQAGPIMETIIANNLPPGLDASARAQMPQAPNPLTAPLGVLVRWFMHAGFLWLCIHLVSAPVRFWTVLTVVGYSYIVVSIGELCGVALLHYRGVAQLTNPLALYGDFGLNHLVPGEYGMAMESLLRSIGVFSVWHLVLLTTGLTVIGRMRPGRAFLVSFVTWVFPALLGAATFSFLEKIRSLTM